MAKMEETLNAPPFFFERRDSEMVKSFLLAFMLTAPLDQLWTWFWVNVDTIASLLIIGGAITGGIVYLIERSRHPSIEILPVVGTGLDTKTRKIVEEGKWLLKWVFRNRGRVTAQNVRLTLHIFDPAAVMEGQLEEHNLTIFEGIDLVPERKQQQIPTEVQFFYTEGEGIFTLAKFNQGFIYYSHGEGIHTFPIRRTEKMPDGGYIFTFHLSGTNLRDEDRDSKSWSIYFPKGKPPRIVPFTRPPLHEPTGHYLASASESK